MGKQHLQSGFVLGQWTVRPPLGKLTNGPQDHHLEPQVMRVLLLLAENSGELVPRSEIIDEVWDGRPVSDDGLSRCIAELRKILGDDARNPHFIETVPKRGYRLLPDAKPLPADQHAGATDAGAESLYSKRRRLVAALFAFTLVVVGTFYVLRSTPPPTPDNATAFGQIRHTIAVLPFKNRSDVLEDTFMVDGLHDDLLTHLSQIGQWNVISRTSVEQFRDSGTSARDIGEQLNATLILEGGVQRSGDAVRINVQLIDSQLDTHLWAATYDTSLSVDNFFQVQSEIVESVASELAGVLPTARSSGFDAPTHSHIAYNHYIKGRRQVQAESVTSLNAAVGHFRAAIAIDDQYAEAHAALADAYLSLGIYFFDGLTYEDAVARAEPLVLRALEVDPDLPQAHVANGLMQIMVSDSGAAEDALRRAIELQPSYPRAYRLFANLRWRQGRADDAIELAEHAESLDPLSGPIRLELGRYYEAAGRFDDAIEKYVVAADLMPENALTRIYIGALNFLVFGNVAESLIWYHEAAGIDPESATAQAMPAIVYLELGDTDRAARFVSRAMAMDSATFWPRFAQLLLNLRLGNQNAAAMDADVLLASYPQSPDALRTLRDRDLAANRPDRALARYTRAHPELTEPAEPQVSAPNLFAAVDLARVYAATGQDDRAATLATRALELTESRHRLGTQGYWLADVQALAIQGHTDAAMRRLEDAIDEGYRIRLWYQLRQDPNLDNIRDLPAYRDLLAEVDTLIDAQVASAETLRETLRLE